MEIKFINPDTKFTKIKLLTFFWTGVYVRVGLTSTSVICVCNSNILKITNIAKERNGFALINFLKYQSRKIFFESVE